MKNSRINCIIIHGCPSNPESDLERKARYYHHWIPWVKQKLTEKGIETATPLMPEPWKPDYLKFKKEIEKQKITDETILVGHSCGCAFLVRWLGETKRRIKKLVLVAPWKINDKNDKWRKLFYGYIVEKIIKERVREIILYTADNEMEDGKMKLKYFSQSTGKSR